MKKSMLEEMLEQSNKYLKMYRKSFEILVDGLGVNLAKKNIEVSLLIAKELNFGAIEFHKNKLIINKNKLIKTYMKMYRENNKIA